MRRYPVLMRKTAYLATTLVAFALGLTLGLALPVYMRLEQRGNSTSVIDPPAMGVSFPEAEEVVGRPAIVDGIYWGERVERALPTGYGEPEAERWRRFVRSNPVVKIEEGCGRMQNRLLTFEDGTKACCRYRQNTDQIQGEIFSFYLGMLLGIGNLAPSALGVIRSGDPVWSRVGSQIGLARWAEDRPVVLTRFLEGLGPARIPETFRTHARKLHPRDVSGDERRLAELAQWSDLIVFDYLTANLDRIVNNLYNLQWNPGMMEAPAHNLAKSSDSELLVFLDNESGLLHGYRLLEKYESYHSVLLNALCVFRRGTVEMVDRLRAAENVGDLLNARLAAEGEQLPGLPDRSARILKDRLNRVHDQVEWCKKQYPQ